MHVPRSSRAVGRVSVALVALALALRSAPVAAQSDDENARRHFESGAAYLEQSDYENALREFDAAYRLSKRAPLLLNVATVHERMGNLDGAISALEAFLVADPTTAERATVETRIANLKKRRDAAAKVVVAPSAAPAASPTPVTSAAPKPAAAAPDRTTAYIVLGAGGASAVGALVTGLVAKSKYDDARKTCKPDCSDATVSSIERTALVSDVLSGLALVGVGVGAYLFFTAEPKPEARPTGLVPAVGGGVAPSAASLEATWRF